MALAVLVSADSRSAWEAAATGVSGVELEWLVYRSEEEIRGLLEPRLQTGGIEGVVLGPMPYDRCRDLLPDDLPVRVMRVGSAELGIALARAAAHGLPLTPVSIDTFSLPVVQEVVRALGRPLQDVGCLPYASGVSPDRICEFHLDFTRRHPGSYAITGRSEVGRFLKDRMTVIDRLAVQSSLRRALREIVLRIKSKRAGDLSFGAAVLRVLRGASGDLDRSRIALHHLLLQTPEYAEAWIEDRGDSSVVVFAHRALLERATQGWEAAPIVDAAEADLGLVVAAGFGLGSSARASVRFADQAAARAEAQGGRCGYLMGENGTIVGPLGRAGRLAFAYRGHPEGLERLARVTGLSAMTISRLIAVEREKKGQPISPAELAGALGITDPSGRRLMRNLAAHALGDEVGTAQASHRGRPTRLYRLRLTENLAPEGSAAGAGDGGAETLQGGVT